MPARRFDLLKVRWRLRRWFISAPLSLAILLLVAGGAASIVFGGVGIGHGSAAAGERANAATLRTPTATVVSSAESQLSIELSAQKQLAAQIKLLEAENIRLKEDLAFFESLLPADRAKGGISIRRMRADIAGPNQLRYRLLVMQVGRGEKDFKGMMQLAVTVLQNGKSAVLLFPDGGNKTAIDLEKYQVTFKRYQRVDGLLTLPDGAQMKSVQARVLENGQLRAQQTAIIDKSS